MEVLLAKLKCKLWCHWHNCQYKVRVKVQGISWDGTLIGETTTKVFALDYTGEIAKVFYDIE